MVGARSITGRDRSTSMAGESTAESELAEASPAAMKAMPMTMESVGLIVRLCMGIRSRKCGVKGVRECKQTCEEERTRRLRGFFAWS